MTGLYISWTSLDASVSTFGQVRKVFVGGIPQHMTQDDLCVPGLRIWVETHRNLVVDGCESNASWTSLVFEI